MLLLLFVAFVSSKETHRETLLCKDHENIPEVVVEWWDCRPYIFQGIAKGNRTSSSPDGKPTFKIKFFNIVKFKVPEIHVYIHMNCTAKIR